VTGEGVIMSKKTGSPHIVITPSRDESEFLPSLIQSMSAQTIIPAKWIIVDHNSIDSTREVVEEARKKHDWIEYLRVSDDNPRKRGAQIARLFNRGISSSNIDWDFCSKVDADMVLPDDYFERIFSEFETSSTLGIASGSCYVISGSRKLVEKVSPDHTRGGLKTYLRKCYDEIGGIREVNGWDGIDNIIAQMRGWETRHVPEAEVRHMRMTGSYSGLNRGCFESGQFAYSMRYFPPFILARSIHRMSRKPRIIGGLSMFAGYLHAFFFKHPAACEKKVIDFLRWKQRNHILNLIFRSR
tara:strand:- start:68 stop:964 length:897 start_codon:yes stop_codon:yes gene_type:complete